MMRSATGSLRAWPTRFVTQRPRRRSETTLPMLLLAF